MIRIFNAIALALFSVVIFSGGVVDVEAASKSAVSTINNIPELFYIANDAPVRTSIPLTTTPPCEGDNSCRLHEGLESGSTASVIYKAKLINVDTNIEIRDRSVVPVGTRFRVVRDTSTLSSDISWNGTGRSMDTPYGRWVANADPLSLGCNSSDRLSNITTPAGVDGVYVLLNVAPPQPVVVNPVNLTCDASNICTVNGPGPVSVGLKFPETNGRFYYRYTQNISPRVGCHGNNAPMSVAYKPVNIRGVHTSMCTGSDCLNATPYDLQVQAKTITFNLSGAPALNTPPTNPVVTPNPLSGTTRISYPFSLTTTDADNDRVRFNIDWNGDGNTDQQQPAIGFSRSLSQSISRTWNAPGTYSFKVQAEDEQGGLSGWTTAVANIILPSPTGLTAVPNGACGSGSITVSWNSVLGATSYTLRDGSTDIYTGSATSFAHTGLASVSTHSYTVRANHASGNSAYSAPVTQSAPADCGVPNLTTLTAPDCTISVGQSTCTTPVTWTISNPVTPKLVQNGTTIGSTPTGSNVTSGPIHYGSDPQNTITVTDTNGQLGQITPQGLCTLGALWDGTVCAHANLESGTITTNDPLIQNTDIRFTAPVTNSGTVSTGSDFRDEFSYQWGVTTGPWNSINMVTNAVLNPTEARTDDSAPLTVSNTGTLYIQHCVDVDGVITETDESNCSVATFTITAPVVGTPEATLTAPSCVIQKGDGSCDTTVTWTSTNVLTPSIRREGAEISTNPNNSSSQTITYIESPVTFTFSDGTTDLVTVNTGAGCANGLVWDGDSCELPATGTITANPPVIPRGGTTNITWTTTNATNCTVAGGADLWAGTADTKPSSPLTADTMYVLSCEGKPLDSVVVDVQGPDINATPRVVPKAGDPVTVTWNPWGVPGCVVNGGGLVNVDASAPGSQSGVIINGNTVFTLSCGGVVEDRARVEVVGRGFET